MDYDADNIPLALPPSLLAAVEAAARAERRAVNDVVSDAVERYLTESRDGTGELSADAPPRLTEAEAVERLLAQRKHNVLPDGVTIRDLMVYGRA